MAALKVSSSSLLTLVFFVAIFVSATNSRCPTKTTCGSSGGIDIRFPFGIQDDDQTNCSYPGFNLRCSGGGGVGGGMPVLNLPFSGEFLVGNICYYTQTVQLYDPDNCLPTRLLSLNLSGSPFTAVSYQNYTFLNCPADLTRSRFDEIDCLSNSTRATLATTSMKLALSLTTMCDVIATLLVPVSGSFRYQGDGFFSSDFNLVVKWDVPNCQDCELKGGTCGFQNGTNQDATISCFYDSDRGSSSLQVFRIISLSVAIPAIICSCGVSYFVYFTNAAARTHDNNGGNNTVHPDRDVEAHAPPLAAVEARGLDECTIESYAKVVVGESRRIPGLNDSTCPICLSEYSAKETLRSIPECKHCFHVDCIDEWLRLHASCPVCRNSPSPPPPPPPLHVH